MILAMPRKQSRVHVVRVRKTHVDKQGRRRHQIERAIADHAAWAGPRRSAGVAA